MLPPRLGILLILAAFVRGVGGEGAASSSSVTCGLASTVTGAPDLLRKCGFTILPNLFEAASLRELKETFLRWSQEEPEKYAVLTEDSLRGDREQTVLPAQEPFLSLPCLRHPQVLQIIEEYLGQRPELDTVIWVQAPPEAAEQNFHMDTANRGSVTLLVPVMDMTAEFAPLSFCPSTHNGSLIPTKPEACNEMVVTPSVGTAVLYDSSVWHTGGANTRTPPETRHALYVSYRLDKEHGLQYDNPIQWVGYPEEIVQTHLEVYSAMRAAVGQQIEAASAAGSATCSAGAAADGTCKRQVLPAKLDGPIPTFIINLHRRPKRRAWMQKWLEPLQQEGQLSVVFVNATDGQDPQPLDERLAQGGFGRFRNYAHNCSRALSERFNFFFPNGTWVEDAATLKLVEDSIDYDHELDFWYCDDPPLGARANGHSHFSAWEAAVKAEMGPYILVLEDDVKIPRDIFLDFRHELEALLARQAVAVAAGSTAEEDAPCDVIYLFKTDPWRYVPGPMHEDITLGQADKEPDAHGWLTVGYSWMCNAYMLSQRALHLIVESDYRMNLMPCDDIVPALVTKSPLRNVESYARKSGIGEQLRACMCVAEKCHHKRNLPLNSYGGLDMEYMDDGISDTS